MPRSGTLLPATGSGIFLNAGTCGPLPAETQRAMDEQAASELAVGRAKIDQFLVFFERMAEARAAIAAALVADPDDIALTHSTTDGINLVLSSLPWQPGDRVITTNHEHPGVLGPLQSLRDRLGVVVETVDIGDGGDPELVLAGIRRALERPARAVVVSHVLWTTGAILPAGAIGTLAREAGAVSIIDGAQSAGAIPVVLDEMDVDAYAVPGPEVAPGPRGHGRPVGPPLVRGCHDPGHRGLPRLRVVRHGHGRRPAARRPPVRGDRLPPPVRRRARPERRLADDVRRPAVGDGPGAAPGCRLATSAWPRSPACAWSRRPNHGGTLVTFRIDGWTANAAALELGPRVFAIIRDLPPIDAIRISVGFWNTEEELERFCAAVELLASHTPETIPPRRTLTILGSDGEPLA